MQYLSIAVVPSTIEFVAIHNSGDPFAEQRRKSWDDSWQGTKKIEVSNEENELDDSDDEDSTIEDEKKRQSLLPPIVPKNAAGVIKFELEGIRKSVVSRDSIATLKDPAKQLLGEQPDTVNRREIFVEELDHDRRYQGGHTKINRLEAHRQMFVKKCKEIAKLFGKKYNSG